MALLTAEQWTAAGTIATAVILAITLTIVYWQVREMRELRQEQFRPWVTVGFHFRSIIVFIAVQNRGNTVARNIRIEFDPELVSTQWSNLQQVSLLNEPISNLAPGEKRITRFDRAPDRIESVLPQRHTVSVTYEDHRGREMPTEEYVLDFASLSDDTIPDKGMHELVEQVTKIRERLE